MNSMKWIVPLIEGLLVMQFIRNDLKTDHRKSLKYKAIASMFFVLIAIGGMIPFGKDKCLIVMGLSCGMAGDILLAIRYLHHGKKKIRYLYAGTLVFSFGHFFYIAFCYLKGMHMMLMLLSSFVISVLITWYFHGRFKFLERSERMTGIVYLLLVGVMASCAIAMFVMNGFTSGTVLYTSGACIFLAADTITVYKNLSKRRVTSVRVVNLVLYYSAQMLIALSVGYL